MTIERSTEQRIKLYYDLHIPQAIKDAGAEDPNRRWPMLIALHGYEGNKESVMFRAMSINSRDFIIAAVQGPNGFFVDTRRDKAPPRIGFGWMMQFKAEETIRLHHETLKAVIRDTSAEFPVDQRAIFLMAFSQSVSLNYRFAFSNPGVVRGVIGVCGGIPGDWATAPYHQSNTDVLIIAGESDEFYPPTMTGGFKDKLLQRSPNVEYHNFPVGHEFPRDADPLINDWMMARVPK